ncbi:multidrug effflux MFS transporter [Paenibacillus sp. FSL R7-0048]|jgi:Bcr/CflA subfamily drug resistance transporter|uniref:Bcr/CflA family efflux transporter n=1 Tax=Paenibacillus odorifer TaxID=189426 RepID=A0A1R0X8F3_9BACL|nr:multidrug effflux MFS transporter [Paenibacillus odorifer]OMD30958.1 Bcr/CflA family drug resistance efflux transporter [Paenibacillus odorifer]OMD62508.1 Bcr/CflA family drug resistance efflux transporter [Paenibacillus odorifer]OMD74373.1 Bcr/CflA family drug resistance efflux transporter [Paenibacillus odorifer]OMD81638.1 Bcr/CflA family drug resistance efflux transporter [Paenibacillus odorifer]OMD84554.1 Bcr/CflA family drug resistance efflux transporter [Paenibacillus odorifer]
MKKYAAPSLLLMIVLVAFPQISETIYTPSLPDIAVALGATNSSVQLTLSIYFIGFALGVFSWGWLSDFIGRRSSMLAGLLVYGMGSLMCFYSESIHLLLVSRFIQAFGAATGSIITQTILRESVSGNKRHVMFAQISAVIAFTPAVGPLIGGWVDQAFGFRAVFFTLVMMSVLLFMYAFWKLPETTDVSMRKKVAILPIVKKMLALPRVLVFGLLIGGINGILFSYYAEAPFIFIEHFQISPGVYGFLGIIVALASIVGAMISKRLLTLYAPEKIIHIGCLVMASGALLLTIASSLDSLPDMIVIVCILITLFVLLMGAGIALPNCLSLALVQFQDVVGTAGAIFSLGYYLLVSLATWGMSALHNGSLLTMPIYFLGISGGMWLLGKKFIVVE